MKRKLEKNDKNEVSCFRCDICNKIYFKKQNLKNHITEDHTDKKYKCPVCPKRFVWKSSWEIHKSWAHRTEIEDNFKCAHCDKGFDKKSRLISHIQWFHSSEFPKQFKLVFLKNNYESMSSESLDPTENVSKSMEANEKISEVDIEKPSTSTNALPSSTIVPHEYHCPPYHCEKCDKSYPGEKDEQKLVKCPVCDALEHHKSHGISEMQCNICNRSFTRKCYLKRHISVVHNKMKPFKCPQHGKSFPQKGALKSHAVVHTTQTFECSICKKRFNRHSQQKRHVHTSIS